MKLLAIIAIVVCLGGCAHRAGTGVVEPLQNPLSTMDIADPSILRQGDHWYAYSTSGCPPGGSYPIHRSANLRDWQRIGYIFPANGRPAWVGACDYWAPEVHRIDGRYVAYYSARDKNRRFCIGAAVADSPEGPFVDVGAPIQRSSECGLIDASYFRDPRTGRGHLLWKEDRNDLRPQEPTGIFMAPLSPDGLNVVGEAVKLIENDAPWEGVLVEAPSLIRRGRWYYLFYSGNAFGDDRYGVGVARSRHPYGPYEKNPANPILQSDDRFSGPGHQFLYRQKGGDWLMFHHGRDRALGTNDRLLMVHGLRWNAGGWPKVETASIRPD